MRRTLRHTARGQPISHFSLGFTILAVAFLFVIPSTTDANTTDRAKPLSTIPLSDDEPRLRKLEIQPSSFVLSD